MPMKLLATLLCALSCSGVYASKADAPSEPFRLVTSYSTAPPSSSVVGSATSVVADCIFNNLGVSYELTQLPWLRAHMQLVTGRADGILPMINQPQLEEVAKRSAPFGLEKWYWFSKSDTPITTLVRDKSLAIATLRGSNHALWLARNGYINVMEVESTSQLSRLLDLGRVDAVFFELQWALDAYGEQFGASGSIKFHFERYAALGLYVAEESLKRFPDFMRRFNREIEKCSPEWVALSDVEVELIKTTIFEPVRVNLGSNSVLKGALQAAASQPASEVLADLDDRWRAELKSGDYNLIKQVVESPLSLKLRQEVGLQRGSISELIVTDRFGANVAASQPTSDYWQGDEIKFRSVVSSGYKTYFGPMQYDASTQKFQTQISAPILDEAGVFIGLLVMGVDVERALDKL